MDTRQYVVFVLSCVGRSSAKGRLSVKGLLQNVRKRKKQNWLKEGAKQEEGY